jgi:hypothetical protein
VTVQDPLGGEPDLRLLRACSRCAYRIQMGLILWRPAAVEREQQHQQRAPEQGRPRTFPRQSPVPSSASVASVNAGVARPLVFVDVDGVLIPFRPRPSAPHRRGIGAVHGGDGSGNPLLERLDPDDGRRLLDLPGDLVWASTWLADANEVVAPRLGLPALPVVDWPDDDEADQRPGAGLHWKTVALSRWAAGRAFVWLDDEMTGTDQRWVAANHPEPALLHRVDPRSGLTEADLAAVAEWLHER